MFDDTKAYMPTSNAAWIYWYSFTASMSSLVNTKYRIYFYANHEYLSCLAPRSISGSCLKNILNIWFRNEMTQIKK